MKSRTRCLLVSGLASLMLTLPIKPASASLTDTTFTDLFSIFQQAFEDARAYLEDLLSGTLAHFPGDLDGVIMNAVGNLGLVDPNQVRSDIAEELVSTLTGDLAYSDSIYCRNCLKAFHIDLWTMRKGNVYRRSNNRFVMTS